MSKPVRILYEFRFEDHTHDFEIELEREAITLIPKHKGEPPRWTELGVGICDGCPLVGQVTHCPIAHNLADLVEEFKNETSHREVEVWVHTEERSITKKVPVQVALFSMFGIIMATSGCPKMDFLKPMARFHLPFSSLEETVIRSVSFYLLRQYFNAQNGKEVDLELKRLDDHYAEVQRVNQGMVRRIKTIMKDGDANQNSITTLDCFSKMLSMAINKNMSKYAYLFKD